MIFFALCSIVFFKYYLFHIKMIAIFIDMCGIGCLNSLLCDICIFSIFSILSYNLFCVFRFLPIFAFKFMIVVSNMKA